MNKNELGRKLVTECSQFGLMFSLLLGISTIIALTGCKTRYIPTKHTITETTTVIDTVKEVMLVPYKDSIATKDTVSYLFNEYAFSYAKWSDGMLHHSLGIFPNKVIIVEVPKTIIVRREEKVPEIIKVEKELNKWQRFKQDYSIYIIIVLSIIIIWIIKKKVLL